jgi:hypothetical protein
VLSVNIRVLQIVVLLILENLRFLLPAKLANIEIIQPANIPFLRKRFKVVK